MTNLPATIDQGALDRLRQMRAQESELGDLVSLTFHGRETSRTGAQFNPMGLVVLKAETAASRDHTLLLPS